MSRIDQKAPAPTSGGVGPDVGGDVGKAKATSDTEDVDSLAELTLPEAGDVATLATVAGGAGGLHELRSLPNTFGNVAGGVPPASARWAGGALNVVGAAATGLDKLESSSAQTTAGKVADGAASGGLAFALGSNPATGAFFAIDALTEKAVERSVQAFASDADVKAKVGFGTYLNASVTAATVLAEMRITGDETAGRDFVKKAKDGDYGMIMEGYVRLGDDVLDATPIIDAGFNL